jgi:chromosome segregation ATPase
MSEEKDAYVKKLKAKMEELNAEIDKMAAKAKDAEADAQIAYSNRLEDLRAKRKDVEEKLAQVQQAGGAAWQDLKQGLENSWDILKMSFSKAKSEFERGYREGREEK